MKSITKAWVCAQIGAREHYAIPRVLHQAGKLQTLFTDFWAGSLLRGSAQLVPLGPLRSLGTRWHEDLDKAEVISWNCHTLVEELRLKAESRKQKIGNQTLASKYQKFIEIGENFAIAVREELKQRRDLTPNQIFFGYDTGSLETMQYLKGQGVPCVVGQMDPNRVEADLVRAEEKLWPGWSQQAVSVPVPDAYFKRREQEWIVAERVVVNSEFSKRALIQQGVPLEKLVVIPLCYEAGGRGAKGGSRRTEDGGRNAHLRAPTSHLHPLRVLFLGQVILRKGIQYLIEAAKLLHDEPVRFDVVGAIGILADAVKSAPSNMTFHGRATRDETARWYEQSDVFVLPTISDGFAITQIEAMAHGLPVIATPNCGDVVTDGMDGFIVPVADGRSLAKMIHRYVSEPELLPAQRQAAIQKSKQFTLDKLAERLLSLENELSGGSRPSL